MLSGMPCSGSERVPSPHRGVRGPRLPADPFRVDEHERVQRGIEGLDALEMGVYELDRRQLPPRDQLGHPRGRKSRERAPNHPDECTTRGRVRMRSGGVSHACRAKHLPISFSFSVSSEGILTDSLCDPMDRISSALTTATTRTATAAAVQPGDQGHLAAAEVIASAHTGLRYRIGRLLGKGGFGHVYLATRLGPSRNVPEVVGMKVSPHIDGWVREAYFGQLLDDHPRALRVYDAFPLMRPDGRVLYCLALEYARHGDLSTALARAAKGWSEPAARREIAGILQVLGTLHRGQMLHRDLTPMNVFVCDGHRLKLGDFGIARQQRNSRGITAHTMNRSMVPSDFLAGGAPKWQARDDVYQMGQLLAMLVKGDAGARIRTTDVRRLPCSDHLKEIVHRCIGERRKRYESADELIDALRTPPARLQSGVLRTLRARTSRSRES